MSTSNHSMLLPQTATVTMEPPALSSPVATDKYDEIYAKYSAAIDMEGGLKKNNDAPSSSSSSANLTSAVIDRQRVSTGMDPPEEFEPSSMQHKSTSSVSRSKQNIYSSSSITSQYNQGQHIPAPTASSVASRDDDSTVHSSAQYSVRSDNGGVRGGSSGSSTQRRKALLVGSSHQQRDAIYTKLEALNAKSRALRGITYNTTTNNAGTTSSSSSYSPSSVMSSSPYVSSSSQRGRRMSDESVVDSRLEYLTKQSLAYRNNNNGGLSVSSSPMTSSYNNKKVTFESDYMNGSNSKSSINNRYENSIPSSSAISITSGGASVTSASSNSITASMNHNVVVSDRSSSSNNSLAMKILSEKILDGYTMTRSHCPNCNMALLKKKKNPSSTKKKASFTFNPDGTLDMSSLRNHNNTDSTHEEEEEMCAFCPINNLRKSISRRVCKRVMATKLLSSSGLEVVGGNGTTKSLCCTNCSSPSLLINAQGRKTSMECQVCPILDTICVEIVREQSSRSSNGGISSVLSETRLCGECGCPELMNGEGSCKCVVCEVLNAKLLLNGTTTISGGTSTSFPNVPSNDKSSSVYFGGSVAGGGTVFPHQQTDSRSVNSSSILGTSLVQSSSISAGGGQSVYDTSRSVAGGGTVTPKQIPFTSLLPAFPASPFKYINNEGQASNNNNEDAARIDLVKLHQQIQDELAKVKLSQKSLLIPPLVCQPIDQEEGQSEPLDQEIVKSPSITSGGGSPIDLAKIQDALTKTIQKMDPSHSSSSPTADLSRLQEQLKAELAKAKQSQAALERTIQMSNVTTSGASSNNGIIKLTRDELIAELDNAKKAQESLEKIIAGTNKIEQTLSENPSLAADDLTQELLLAAASWGLGQESYSISQQEVDALGNIKEYIPEPSIFRYNNIPKVVVVYHVPDEDDCDPSVAVQSHHTKNLKRSERDHVPAQSSMFDCCGGEQHQLQQYHDDETIETDEDDYTLNTMDDSRFDDDYIHASRSMISSMRGGDNNDNNNKGEYQHQQLQRGIVSKSKGGDEEEENCQPKSSTGRCIFSCFGCGTDDDVYTMVESSKRGIQVQDHPQQNQHQQHYHHELLPEEPPRCHGQRKSLQNISYNQEMGQGDFSVGSSSIRRNYFREDSDRIRRNFFRKDSDSDYYSSNRIAASGSDFGSTCRAGESLPPKAPKRSGMTPPPPPPSSNYSIDGSDYDRSSPLFNQKMDKSNSGVRINDGLGLNSSSNKRTNTRSPSPLSDWDSVNGSDFGSINHVSGSPYQPQHPKSSLLRPPISPNRFSSDNYSVTSELSDQSSFNRRVRFGGSPSQRGWNNNGYQQQLRALTEESIDNDDMDSHQYSVDTEMLLNRLESATSGR